MQEKANHAHNRTIDRVVEKQDPINDEIPMRTRATREISLGRDLGGAE